MFKWFNKEENESKYIDLPKAVSKVDAAATITLSSQNDFRFHCYVDEDNFNILKDVTKEYAVGYLKSNRPEEAIYHVDIPIKIVELKDSRIIINVREYY